MHCSFNHIDSEQVKCATSPSPQAQGVIVPPHNREPKNVQGEMYAPKCVKLVELEKLVSPLTILIAIKVIVG